MGTVSMHPDGIAVEFDYDPDLVESLREALPGSRFDRKAGAWLIDPVLIDDVMRWANANGWRSCAACCSRRAC